MNELLPLFQARSDQNNVNDSQEWMQDKSIQTKWKCIHISSNTLPVSKHLPKPDIIFSLETCGLAVTYTNNIKTTSESVEIS